MSRNSSQSEAQKARTFLLKELNSALPDLIDATVPDERRKAAERKMMIIGDAAHTLNDLDRREPVSRLLQSVAEPLRQAPAQASPAAEPPAR